MFEHAYLHRNLYLIRIELNAARKLGRKLQQVLWRDFSLVAADGFETLIMYLLLLRAERTFYSLRALARLRQVDDALALSRLMVEKVINAEYIMLMGENAAIDYIQFDAFRLWRDLEDMRASTPEIAPKYDVEFLTRLKTAHDQAAVKLRADGSTVNRYGRGHDWTDVSVAKRAEKIDKILGERFSIPSCNVTRMLYQKTYKKSSKYVHGTWESLARSIKKLEQNETSDQNVKAQVSFGLLVKDKDLGAAIEAVQMGNLTAMMMLLFAGRVFKQDEYLVWVAQFKESYIKLLKVADELAP